MIASQKRFRRGEAGAKIEEEKKRERRMGLPIQNIRAWHEELLEFILAHPRATLWEAALFFNVTPGWISNVKNSDAFQELWAKRRGEHFSRISASVSDRVLTLAETTVDALQERIEKEAREGTATVSTLREVGEMALKSLGFGGRPQSSAPAVTVNNVMVVDRETLARARETRARLQEGEIVKIEEIEEIEEKREEDRE